MATESARVPLILGLPFSFIGLVVSLFVVSGGIHIRVKGEATPWANTYIGNGPNFLVKAIADHQKVHTPTFVGYLVKFTLPFMLPMLIVVWLLFFRS